MQPPAGPHQVFSTAYNQHFAKGLVRHPQKDHLQQLSARRHQAVLQALAAEVPPSSWDSCAKGWVGPIKDQASCGSCWDYSGTGTVEIAYNVAGAGGGPDKLILSEQYTLDCGRNGGCGGDDNVTVLEWAKKTGLPLSVDYGPYHASAGRCQFKQQQTLYKIDDWGFADSSQGQRVTPTDLIKAAIMKYGCVGAAIAADGAFSNIQPGQVFDRTTSQGIDHDIILVGWDDSKGSKGAWKLRNSWGTSWADGGYCYIGYGVNLVGTEAVWAYVNHQNPPIDWYC